MRTDDLIDVLMADHRPVPLGAVSRRLTLAAALGAAAALGLVLTWLRLRPDLPQAIIGGFFWIKALYTAALAIAGFWATKRLGRPEVQARGATAAGLLILAGFLGLAVVQFVSMQAADRMAALRGVSWTVCSCNIVMLAAPMLIICLYVLRRLAPTRPWSGGFAAGVFSGGTAATVYGLHCPEATFVFVGVWYTLGVILTGLVGALVGKVTLKW